MQFSSPWLFQVLISICLNLSFLEVKIKITSHHVYMSGLCLTQLDSISLSQKVDLHSLLDLTCPSMINNYYSFKIFSRFWLVKTTRTIHHNQLLFTKFGKNLCHIESMTSKVEPTENYWTNDVKMTSKMHPPQIIEPLTEKTWGQGCVIFGERKNKERNGETPLRRRTVLNE